MENGKLLPNLLKFHNLTGIKKDTREVKRPGAFVVLP